MDHLLFQLLPFTLTYKFSSVLLPSRETSPFAVRKRPHLRMEPTVDDLSVDDGPMHVMVETVQCALSGCVPCCAKVLVNQGASTVLPNARPETCFRLVRAANSTQTPCTASVGLYRQGQWILTVGDGDFSFSLALARALQGARVIATSYESRASLEKVYGAACTDALRELAQLGARVAHGVDAAELRATLPVGAVPTGGFDRIVWNFPCAAAPPLHRPASTPSPRRPRPASAPPLRQLRHASCATRRASALPHRLTCSPALVQVRRPRHRRRCDVRRGRGGRRARRRGDRGEPQAGGMLLRGWRGAAGGAGRAAHHAQGGRLATVMVRADAKLGRREKGEGHDPHPPHRP